MALRRALLSLRPSAGSVTARTFGTAPTGPVTVADRSCVSPPRLGSPHVLVLPPVARNSGVSLRAPTDPPDPRPTPAAIDSIDITVVLEGVRHKLKGKIGKTLAQALAESNDPALEEVVPEVSLRQGPDTHVSLPPDIVKMLPELDLAEATLLEDIAENPGPISRMASQVVLSAEMNGMAVAVAPNRPYPRGAGI